MKRHFYLSSDLDDLEVIEQELEDAGLSVPQIHVISKDDTGLDNHRLNQVHQWFQTDVIHSTLKGAVIGCVIASAIIGAAYLSGAMDFVGGFPFIFLSVVLLGFCTWEAGFIGTQLPNRHFKKFQKALNNGKHLLMVDVNPDEESTLKKICKRHPKLHHAGEGGGAPRWTIFGQRKAQELAQ